VERVHASEDRWKVMVRITQEGVEFLAHIRNEIATDLTATLSAMDEETAESDQFTRPASSSRAAA